MDIILANSVPHSKNSEYSRHYYYWPTNSIDSGPNYQPKQ